MAAIINQEIPEFSTEAFVNGEFKTITSDDVKGNWAVFMFIHMTSRLFAQLSLKTWQTIIKS